MTRVVVTFVIGKDGLVHEVIRSEFNIDVHLDEAMATLRRLQEGHGT